MKIGFVGVIAACVALSGCQSESPAKGETLVKMQAQCAAYGFKPGTDVYAACVYQSDQNRISQNRDARLRFAAAMQNAGAQMQANAAANRPKTCYTSKGYGNNYTTRCY